MARSAVADAITPRVVVKLGKFDQVAECQRRRPAAPSGYVRHERGDQEIHGGGPEQVTHPGGHPR